MDAIDDGAPRRYYPKAVRWKSSSFPECEAFWPFDGSKQKYVYEGRTSPFASWSECELECLRLEERAASER